MKSLIRNLIPQILVNYLVNDLFKHLEELEQIREVLFNELKKDL